MDAQSTEKRIVVEEKIATKEVAEWAERMGFTPRELEEVQMKGAVEKIVYGVMYGSISIDPATDVLIQKLVRPCGEVTELRYNPDTDIGTINKKLAGAKMDMGMLTYHAAAFTDKPNAIIEKLTRNDARMMKIILGFFM